MKTADFLRKAAKKAGVIWNDKRCVRYVFIQNELEAVITNYRNGALKIRDDMQKKNVNKKFQKIQKNPEVSERVVYNKNEKRVKMYAVCFLNDLKESVKNRANMHQRDDETIGRQNNVEKVFSKKDAKPGDLPYIGKNVFRLERMFLLVIA